MSRKAPTAQWVQCSGGSTPQYGVEIGRSGQNREMMYVGRAVQGRSYIPGKIVPSHHVCYVGHDLKEIGSSNYEALNIHGCNVEWRHACNGQVPTGAIEAGKDSGEPLFIGRARLAQDGQGVHGGKVHPSHGCLYIPYGGKEVRVTEYEVLCRKFKFM